MEGCSYCQHNCKIKIMNSLNYIMLTTRYLLLLQSFRQEETIIELLLEIKHIMQVGENSILLGYCALPLGVIACCSESMLWPHLQVSGPVSSIDHWPLKVRPLQSPKAWEITPTKKSKYLTKKKVLKCTTSKAWKLKYHSSVHISVLHIRILYLQKGTTDCHHNYIYISVSLPVTSFGFCKKP